jgi:hypothetical protein
MDDVVELTWSHGRARVHATAAMLDDLVVTPDARSIAPLARRTWDSTDEAVQALPGHLRVLGGDFVCAPFGSALVPADAPPHWQAVASALPAPAHGIAADASWHLTADGPGGITATVEPDASSPLARLVRRIRGISGRARVEFDLEITARRAHRTTLGLHPILALPPAPAAIEVDFAWGRVWPGRLHPAGRPLPDTTFTSLAEVPAVREPGGHVDLSRVPSPHPTEEVVQLVGARSPFTLRRDDGVRVVVEWDDATFDSLLLWSSDRGIDAPPWNGRYRGLGVEPVISAFDLPPGTSLAGNPLSAAGARTSIELHPHRPVRTWHAIEVLV